MSKAYRHKILVTVYSGSPTDAYPNMSLTDIDYAITYGEDIGDVEMVESNVEVEGGELRKQLIAIGNDGTFFDRADDDEEDLTEADES